MTVLSTGQISSTLTRGLDGWRHNVVYLVSGSSLKNAIDQTVPHGTESTEIPGIYAFDFAAEHEQDQSQMYRVTVTYRRRSSSFSTGDDDPDPTPVGGTTQIGARLQPAIFTRDAAGSEITTVHTYAEAAPGRTGTVTQPAEVEGFLPTTVLTVSRRENNDPQNLATFYVGKLNSGTFRGQPTGSWLCTAIEGVSEDSGDTYTCTYEFEFKPGGWDATVAFIDDKTNRPVNPLVNGVSRKTYRIYSTVSFSGLNL